MKKKKNKKNKVMRNEDNDCIRYLMKEMDPSEELLIERAMMEDEDLLIEVESMRQTLSKLDRLPQKNPPSELTNKIIKQAAEQAEHNRESQKTTRPVYKYAVAATLALTLTAGGAWLFMGGSGEESTATTTTAVGDRVQPQNVSEQPLFDIDEIASFTSLPAEEQEVAPWIDRSDILRFEDQVLNNNARFNALRESSTQKMRLIDSPAMQNQRVKSIQLTGTGNQ